jgi:hypothetical protein
MKPATAIPPTEETSGINPSIEAVAPCPVAPLAAVTAVPVDEIIVGKTAKKATSTTTAKIMF